MKKPLLFICWQKINFILHVFHVILQRYCKLVIYGTFSMTVYTHPKSYYKHVGNLCVYQQAKTTLCPPSFSVDIAKICKLLGFRYFGHACLWTPKMNNTSMFICITKINFISHFFLEILHFKESHNLIGILAHNSRIRILPDMGLVMKLQ